MRPTFSSAPGGPYSEPALKIGAITAMPNQFCVDVVVDATDEDPSQEYYSIASVSGDDPSACSAHSINLMRHQPTGFIMSLQCDAGGSTSLWTNHGANYFPEHRQYEVAFCYYPSSSTGQIFVDRVLAHEGSLVFNNVASAGHVSILSGAHESVDDEPTGTVIVRSLDVYGMDTTDWSPGIDVRAIMFFTFRHH